MNRVGRPIGAIDGQKASQPLIKDLVKIRKAQNINQETIARMLGVTQGCISQIETLKTESSFELIVHYAMAIGANISVSSPVPGKPGRKKQL